MSGALPVRQLDGRGRGRPVAVEVQRMRHRSRDRGGGGAANLTVARSDGQVPPDAQRASDVGERCPSRYAARLEARLLAVSSERGRHRVRTQPGAIRGVQTQRQTPADEARQRTGRFVLTGSTQVLAVPAIADSLAGRLETVRLHPLAQRELAAGDAPGTEFIDALYGDGFPPAQTERMGSELTDRIVAGGYPPALARPPGRRRANWYRNFIEAQVQRDVGELARTASLDVLPRLLGLAATQTARLFNLTSLASQFQLSRPTIGGYMTLLQRVYLLEQLPPWYSNRGKRLIKTPKLHFGDTGLACALLGASASALREDRPLLGHLLETFVFQELRRQATWHGDPVDFFHYRDRDRVEVDIVLESGGRVAGVEVKAGGTVTGSDFRGLRKLRDACGEQFAAGVVLYDGETSVGFGEGLYAVPVRRLWGPL